MRLYCSFIYRGIYATQVDLRPIELHKNKQKWRHCVSLLMPRPMRTAKKMVGCQPPPRLVVWGRPAVEEAIAERPSEAVAPTQGPLRLRARPRPFLCPFNSGRAGGRAFIGTLFSFVGKHLCFPRTFCLSFLDNFLAFPQSWP